MPALFGRGRNVVSAGGPGSPPYPGSLDGWTVEQVVRQRMIAVEYRAVVRLDSGEVVGFRAVPCAPPASCFDTTEALWRAAREIGLTAELDQVAHAASYRDMLAARTHPSVSLLVRADPRELDLDAPPDLADVVATALSRVRVFVEISADNVLAAPARALAGIAKARACGWGIAWDQLGDSPTAFTLIPFVQPDLVTVDVHLLDAPHAAAVLDPLRAYTERSGASLMVTGIESDAQLHGALAAGATLGQGRYHGEPGPIPPTTPAPRHPIPILRAPGPSAHTTPYEILTDARPPVHTTAQVLDQIADHLAQRCCVDPEPPAILITAPTLSEPLHKRLTDLAGKAGLLVVFTPRPPAEAPSGVRFVAVDAGDPLARQWSLTVVGPHFCALLAARDDGPDQTPYRYSYALTHHRSLVLQAARALLGRLTEQPAQPATGQLHPPAHHPG